MAGLNQWWTDSNAVPPVPPPANPTLTAIQAPATIAGSLVNPYEWPLPLNPLLTGSGPKTPPMGPFGAGVGGMGMPAVSTKTLPNGTHGVVYPSQTLVAVGGVGPYTWAVTTGAVPAGMTLSAAGVLSGTATAAGTTNFSVTATDAKANASPAQALTIVMA